MSSFQNKVVVITGGNSGIGFATAQLFSEQGARVLITGRRQNAVDDAVKALGNGAEGFVFDAGDIEATQAFFETLRTRGDRIDLLFLNAGIAPMVPLGSVESNAFDQLININLKGPYFALQYALDLLGEGSSVIFNTSIVNKKGMANTSAYAATKAALRAVVRVAAGELGPRGIRVNAVSPGVTRTPILEKVGMNDAAVEAVAGTIPLRRAGESIEIAKTVAFLASEGGGYITGVEIDVDGGLAQI